MSAPTPLGDVGDDLEARRSQATSKIVVGAIVAAATVVGLYFALGMPGMDHSAPTSSSGMDHGGAEMGWTRQGVAEFSQTVGREGVVMINVHIPDEGSIAGTDLTIPYAAVLTDPSLPTDLTTPLALYCRSGKMSTIAAQSLVNAGYTNVVELDGGMNAWTSAGRALGP